MTGPSSRGKRAQTRHAGNTSIARSDRHLLQEKGEDTHAEAPQPRIEPGEYDAICYGFKVATSGFDNQRKLYLKFRVYGGRSDGTQLFMACPYPSGRLSPRTKLHTQWTLAIGRAPLEGERFSRKVFPKKMYTVLVRYTRRQFPGTNKRLPDFCQYSVVSTILEVQTGVPGGY
jgi:hypothetical protein